MVYPGAPYKLSESPWQLIHQAPQAGQHNNEIYGGDLDLSQDELNALAAQGVI